MLWWTRGGLGFRRLGAEALCYDALRSSPPLHSTKRCHPHVKSPCVSQGPGVFWEPVTSVLCKQLINGLSGKGICISLTMRMPIEPGAVLVAPTVKKEGMSRILAGLLNEIRSELPFSAHFAPTPTPPKLFELSYLERSLDYGSRRVRFA
jgi:hypothetical protein